MDVAQKVHLKLRKILSRLKSLNIIQSFELKISFCQIKRNMEACLKEIDLVLKKCLKKIIAKPKRAEIRNIITELVRKKNLSYVSDQFFEDFPNPEPEVENACQTSANTSTNCNEPETANLNSSKKNSLKGSYDASDSNSKNYLCKICGKTFHKNSKCKVHEHSHLNLGNSSAVFKCHYCTLKFSKIEDLNKHNNEHKVAESEKENQKNLEIDKEPSTSTAVVSKGQQTGEKESVSSLQPPLACKCGKVFNSKKSFKKHESVKHSEKVTEHKCVVCEKTFLERGKLNRHMLSHGLSQFQCSECSKQFARSDALKRHRSLAHTQLKGFECSFCGKKFSLKFNRDVHEENVHKILNNWLQCEKCGQKFKTKITLKSHMEIHSTKRIRCSFCNKPFVRKIHYKQHMKSKHFGISPYQTLLDSVTLEESAF